MPTQHPVALVDTSRQHFEPLYDAQLSDADIAEIIENLTAYSRVLLAIGCDRSSQPIHTEVPGALPHSGQVLAGSIPTGLPQSGQPE